MFDDSPCQLHRQSDVVTRAHIFFERCLVKLQGTGTSKRGERVCVGKGLPQYSTLGGRKKDSREGRAGYILGDAEKVGGKMLQHLVGVGEVSSKNLSGSSGRESHT